MKTAKSWAEENLMPFTLRDLETLIEAVQVDALLEAASVVRDSFRGRLQVADVLEELADSVNVADNDMKEKYGNVLSYFEAPSIARIESQCRCLSDQELEKSFSEDAKDAKVVKEGAE